MTFYVPEDNPSNIHDNDRSGIYTKVRNNECNESVEHSVVSMAQKAERRPEMTFYHTGFEDDQRIATSA